jgi:transcriptional regulator with XRE-family HTH domain
MTEEDLGNLGTAIAVLRTIRGRDQAALACATGLQASSISNYERGKVRPSPRTLDRLLSGLRLPSSALSAALLFVRSLQRAEESAPAAGPETTDASFGDAAAGFVRVAAAHAKERSQAHPSRGEPGSEAEAAQLWQRLRRYGARERRAVVNESPQFSSWGLCVLLCEESARAAADDPRKAMDLAELALLVAARVPGSESAPPGLGLGLPRQRPPGAGKPGRRRGGVRPRSQALAGWSSGRSRPARRSASGRAGSRAPAGPASDELA